jgi:hypothetical protein
VLVQYHVRLQQEFRVLGNPNPHFLCQKNTIILPPIINYQCSQATGEERPAIFNMLRPPITRTCENSVVKRKRRARSGITDN